MKHVCYERGTGTIQRGITRYWIRWLLFVWFWISRYFFTHKNLNVNCCGIIDFLKVVQTKFKSLQRGTKNQIFKAIHFISTRQEIKFSVDWGDCRLLVKHCYQQWRVTARISNDWKVWIIVHKFESSFIWILLKSSSASNTVSFKFYRK